MENKANYLSVGIFVFTLFFAIMFVVVWIGGFSHKNDFDYYQIYTKESVSGLGLKAPVRLLGVEVGSVEEIDIHAKDGIGVRILIKIAEGTPITQSTYATLQLQGITGLKFIELANTDSNNTTLLQTSKKNPATIQSKESLFATLNKQSDKLFSLIQTADQSFRAILNEDNLKNIALILENAASFFEKLNQNSDIMIKSGEKVYSMASSVEIAADKVGKLVDDYDDLKYQISDSIELLKNLLIQSNEFLSEIKESPSNLLFKSTKNKPAPGEKK
ncbi:MCE family protein [Campylobacter sp. MIT 99-7217]|uniref:MlaD family protein n=1 Tax=Campylobacter sp. MIT 99-7217 TaxID=535091 RepID=UPI00115A141F|nr:MlaD family protein [Campylobacter sp. MIT 99-7217]TQR32358.1 MCE family protein [Campylobacter sp. MIT 99-7217]